MEEMNMKLLLSESDSDDGITYRPGQNGNRLDSLLKTHRPQRWSLAQKAVVILGMLLFLSMLLNVIFIVTLIFNAEDEMNNLEKPCPEPASSWAASDSKDKSHTETSSLQSATVTAPAAVSTEGYAQVTTLSSSKSSTTPCVIINQLPSDGSTTTAPVTTAAMTPESTGNTTESSVDQSEHKVECPVCDVPLCAKPEKIINKERRNKRSQYERDNVFADLTAQEVATVYTFLGHQPELKVGLSSSSCMVYGIELHTPNKTQAVMYLDSYAAKPPREASVILACGQQRPPLVYEYVVGPLPKPSYYVKNPRRKSHTAPYRFFPHYGARAAYNALLGEFRADLQYILRDSYGASLGYSHCTRCITALTQRTSSAYSDRTIVVFAFYYATAFVTINPLDFMVVVQETSKDSGQFSVNGIFYNDQYHKSVSQFVSAYRAGTLTKTRVNFPHPVDGEGSIRGTLDLRGQAFPSEPQAGPRQFDPEGKRYSIEDQQVKYLRWNFKVRMSTTSGPQVWDVRWAEERIAYEISLQDVGVIYAGANPNTFYTHLSDSAFGLGNKASGLLPGLDCPDHATFLSQVVFDQQSGTTRLLPHSQCVFEHNTGLPLRRHRNQDAQNGRSHGGVVDRVLIVRSIIVEYNYDYIFDVVFHQNGAMELKTYATGYVMSQFYKHAEAIFGFKIHDNIVGSIHHHLFNFKVDLDILGESNRYATLDMVTDDRKWPWYKDDQESFKQISFRHDIKRTEQEAVLRYNFSNPKYYIVYNDERKNIFGNPKAYRIDVKGFSKQILPDDSPVLNSRRWSKYQMAVTKRTDEEEASSSMFSMYDGESPHVDFDDYLKDNGAIVDEDLVFWITVGMHHIPHTEDIPNTPTVGTEATVSLLPYNYFTECPSVGSRDAVNIEARAGKVVRKNYGVSLTSHCVPPSYDYHHLFSTTSYLYA